MSFDQFSLDPRLMAGITRAGFVMPTPVQHATIPLTMAGHDLIGTAQTGTGKTAAFVLPILHRLLKHPRGQTRALIVTPTRELAEQIHSVIRDLGSDTGIRSATVYGGVGAGPQLKALREGVDILIACPGRLLDHIGQRRAPLRGVGTVVLDEADRMLDMGFLPDVRRILEHLPPRRQTLLFSATCPPEIERLAAESLNNPKRVAVGPIRPVHTVSHALFPVAPRLKPALLLALLEEIDAGSVLVFTRTKHRAQRLAQQIHRAGHDVTSLHGDRSQPQRMAALRGFRTGNYRIMVATDIAARGIDVEGISHVVNFDMPDTVDSYIHRIGRTGRADHTGDAFTLITPEDESAVRAIEGAVGHHLPRRTLPSFDYAESPPARRPDPAIGPHPARQTGPSARAPLAPLPARRRNARRVRPAVRFAIR